MTDVSLKQIDIQKIMASIPHRYPMLLIDRILEVGTQEIIALKNVTINENFFNGHFPSYPIMPGVLIVEAMAQAAAMFVMLKEQIDPTQKLVYFMSIEGAHFRKPVIPGDSLHLHVTKMKSRGNVWKMKGEAKVEQQRAADAIFSAMIIDNTDGRRI